MRKENNSRNSELSTIELSEISSIEMDITCAEIFFSRLDLPVVEEKQTDKKIPQSNLTAGFSNLEFFKSYLR
jgi:hypothetical protein